MPIGIQTLKEVNSQITGLLHDYQTQMNDAYLKLEDEDPLTISLSVKISPGNGANKIESSISFVTGRIKDKTSGEVDETQMPLPFDDETESEEAAHGSTPL